MSQNTGCPYRVWAWHDGGPDYRCTKDGKQNWACEDSYSDNYQCKEIKVELVDKV